MAHRFSALGIAAKYHVTAESPTAGHQNQTTDRRERPNNPPKNYILCKRLYKNDFCRQHYYFFLYLFVSSKKIVDSIG
jgi:hypothetical protein